jgi:hypothetical protein
VTIFVDSTSPHHRGSRGYKRLKLGNTATNGFGVLAAGVLTACVCASNPPSWQTPRPQPQSEVREYPGTLRAAAELGADFQWRQQVTAQWPEGTRSFDAVLSKSGQELMLVGLGPMDTPGFVLTLNEKRQLRFENHTGEPVRFNPRYVLLDVQRAFYPWFPSTLARGTRETVVDQERVRETWHDNTLVERTFQRLDNNPPGKIVVTYSGWASGGRAPERARLDNGWFGYVLTIQTLEQSNL